MRIWLDDIREMPSHFDMRALHFLHFEDILIRRGRPEEVSFDHDLCFEHYGGDYSKGRTGHHCLRLLLEACVKEGWELPVIHFHTSNREARERMGDELQNFLDGKHPAQRGRFELWGVV